MNAVLINDTYHAPLLRRWPSVAERANIAEHWLNKSVTQYCSKAVVEWVRKVPQLMREQRAGLVLRPKQHSAEDRCSVVAAACLRNYRDARVMPLKELFAEAKKGVPEVTVLLIPDFYQGGVELPEWQLSHLMSVLSSRHLKGKATVLYVEDMSEMGKTYGEAIYKHIRTNYTTE